MIVTRPSPHEESTQATPDQAGMTSWLDAIADVVARVLGAAVVVGVLAFAVWGTVAPLF